VGRLRFLVGLIAVCVSGFSLLGMPSPTLAASERTHPTPGGSISVDRATLGQQLWAAHHNGPGNAQDVAKALGVSPDGSRVFVTGYSYGGSSGNDYGTLAYDASTGARLWTARYNGPGDADDAAFAIGVSPDGSSVFVTGESAGPAGTYDYATVAYDASSGAKVWVARYKGIANRGGVAYALGVSPDGSKVFVTGESYGVGGTDQDYATVAYDASSGQQLWAARYKGPGDFEDVSTPIGLRADGSTAFVT